MNVLSLFDGISCGRVALNRAGFSNFTYYASEIEHNAITVGSTNYPDTIQLGDVSKINGKDLPPITLLMGGSPCQGFSSIGKNLDFFDPRSMLFFEFVRLLNECKPKYFLLENVKMAEHNIHTITSYLKVKPIYINSSLVSAQNRRRLYWTNIPMKSLPEDKGITLDDVIDHSFSDYRVPKNWWLRVPDHLPLYVDPYNKKEIAVKSTSLRTNVNNGNMWVRVNTDEGYAYRNLTRYECEELQNVPRGYTQSISENMAKKCLGNGWTVDAIVHILKHMEV